MSIKDILTKKYYFKDIFNAILKPSKGIQSVTPDSTPYSGSLKQITPDQALQVSTVYSCVTLLSDTVASLPLNLYKEGDNYKELAKDDQLFFLLHDSPNFRQTTYDFLFQMMTNYLLNGNAYIYKIRSGNTINGLQVLNSGQMEVKLLVGNALEYKYRSADNTILFNEEDLIHIKNIGNGLIGLSTLDIMRSSLNLAVHANKHSNLTVKDGARRAGILKSDQILTEEQRERLKESMQPLTAGSPDSLIILESDFNFQPLSLSPVELQLNDIRQFSNEDIARYFKVPSLLINDTNAVVKLGSSTQQIIEQFYKLTIRPILVKIESIFEKSLLSDAQKSQNYQIKFNVDALLRANSKERYDVYARATQNGLMTRNEVRALEDKAPIEGGDILTIQSNLIDINALGSVEPSQTSNTDDQDMTQEDIRQ